MSQKIQDAIIDLRDKVTAKVAVLKARPEMAEILQAHALLNQMEGYCGEPLTPLAELFGLAESAVPGVAKMVSPGDFLGWEALRAAKEYLRRKGKPASLDEIIDGIKAGSAEIPNREKLRTSLGRSAFDIAKLNEDTFGLLDWYPEEKQKRGSGKKKGNQSAGVDAGAQDLPTDVVEAGK